MAEVQVVRYRGCLSYFLCIFFFPIGLIFWFYPVDDVPIVRSSRKEYEVLEVVDSSNDDDKVGYDKVDFLA